MENEHQASRFLRKPEVIAACGLSSSTIYKRVREGTFPNPIQLGGRLIAWRADDIELWLENPSLWQCAVVEVH